MEKGRSRLYRSEIIYPLSRERILTYLYYGNALQKSLFMFGIDIIEEPIKRYDCWKMKRHYDKKK
jgi:hypothetical protein